MLRRAEGVPERMLGAGCWSDPCTNSCRAQGRARAHARAHARHVLTAKLAHRCRAPEPPPQRDIRGTSRFLNQHLEQCAQVGYELRRVSNHLIDRLMGCRNLVGERLGVATFDAHRPSTLLVSEGLASRTPRVGPGGHPEIGQGEGR